MFRFLYISEICSMIQRLESFNSLTNKKELKSDSSILQTRWKKAKEVLERWNCTFHK